LTFRELLRSVPEARPLSIKLALDRLEKDGRVVRLVHDGKYIWDVAR